MNHGRRSQTEMADRNNTGEQHIVSRASLLPRLWCGQLSKGLERFNIPHDHPPIYRRDAIREL